MRRFLGLSLVLWIGGAAALAPRGPAAHLRDFFEQLGAGAPAAVAGHRLHHPQALAEIYTARAHAPIWSAGGPLAEQAEAMLTAIRRSEAHGFNPRKYHEPLLARMIEGTAQPLPLTYELLLSDAFLAQARHRATGAASPRDLDPEWELIAPEADPAAALREALAPGGSVLETLENLWPRHAEYLALLATRERLVRAGTVEVEPIPDGPLLKPGQSGDRVVALKRRLLGPGDYTPEYDERLKQALLAFQGAAGLERDGIVGPATLEVLNGTTASWVDRLDANLERWRWLPRALPETYLRVNIAAFSLRVIDRGQEALSMDAVVGSPFRRTPIFTQSIKYLVFNPYWNVPYKLAVLDKLPLLKKDPAALAAHGYEARSSNADAFVPVDAIDWSDVTRGNFRFLLRQRPGPFNALGRVKFMLPNHHDVYLHDTPDRHLFERQERGFSSGCVRLSDALGLARWILNHEGRSQEAGRVIELASGEETTTVYLNRSLPVYLVYFTAFTDPSGEVVFRRDLYQRDAAIVAALRAESGP